MSENKKNSRVFEWFDRRDFLLVVGLVLFGWGGWWIFPSLALMVPGLILTGIAIFGVKK